VVFLKNKYEKNENEVSFNGLGLIILFFISSCSNDPSVELPINGKPLLLTEFKSDDEITSFE